MASVARHGGLGNSLNDPLVSSVLNFLIFYYYFDIIHTRARKQVARPVDANGREEEAEVVSGVGGRRRARSLLEEEPRVCGCPAADSLCRFSASEMMTWQRRWRVRVEELAPTSWRRGGSG